MGDGMPYHLEKGPFLRIVERNLNGDRAFMNARRNDLQKPGQLAWLGGLTDLPWTDPAFTKPNAIPAAVMRERLIKEWFGYVPDGPNAWKKPNPPTPTTGYWIGYRGDVETIVKQALTWAVELSLGSGGESGDAPPWPIELFWKCPAPWFEAWVVSRRNQGTASGRVSVIFVSPSHKGAVVADSPIATSDVASVAGKAHPVPSTQDDYELLGHPPPEHARPRPPAVDRDHATWVVSQTKHVPLDPFNTGNTIGPVSFGFWWIPQLAMWEGTGAVVTVAPSMAAGGVKFDGAV